MRLPLLSVLDLRGPLAIVAVMTFVSQLGIGVMLPVIPLYAISLGASPVQLGLLTTAFTLANTAVQLLVGFALDRTDARLPIRAGIATYAGANVLIASAQNVTSLVAYRALAGAGAGANLVADRVYVSLAAEPARLAFVNGVLASAGSAGGLIGPAFGGLLAQVADLRAPFLVVGVTSGIAFLASLTLPRARAATAMPAGTVAPLFTRPLVVLIVANAMLFSGFGGFITTFAPYVTTVLGWSTGEVGVVLSIFGAGSIVLGPPLGSLADRYGRRLVGSWATLPLALFGIAFALGLPRPVLYLVSFFAAGAISGFSAAAFALLTEISPEARRGRTFGIVQALSSLGIVVGANVSALLWESTGVIVAGLVVTTLTGALAGPLLNLLPAKPRTR